MWTVGFAGQILSCVHVCDFVCVLVCVFVCIAFGNHQYLDVYYVGNLFMPNNLFGKNDIRNAHLPYCCSISDERIFEKKFWLTSE